MGCSLPGSSVRGIFQARALEWGAIWALSKQSSAASGDRRGQRSLEFDKHWYVEFSHEPLGDGEALGGPYWVTLPPNASASAALTDGLSSPVIL